MNSFLEIISSGKFLLSDGAMGTELQKRGLPSGACPEEFNILHPEIVQSIHKDYYEAGSDIVETNTFGANRARLKLHGYEERVKEFCSEGVRLAKEVCPPGKFVAGSIGPTGEMFEPLGSLTAKDAFSFFSEQAEALAEAGADVLFVETMMAPEEVELAIKAAKEKTSLPVAASMTFEKGKTGIKTMWGIDVASAVKILSNAGADIIGSNCGKGFDEMIEIVTEMRKLTDKPIIAQANAGIPEWVHGISVYPETPQSIIPKVNALLESGINVLGGCCGTAPEHIKKMRELLNRFSTK